MKTLNIFFAFALCGSIVAHGQQTFSNVSVSNKQDHKMISFTLDKETNIRFFRIEASNDNAKYKIIGTVTASGNSVFAKNYRYDLYDTSYQYYRVASVGMDAKLDYSEVITKIVNLKEQAPVAPGKNGNGENTIVNK